MNKTIKLNIKSIIIITFMNFLNSNSNVDIDIDALKFQIFNKFQENLSFKVSLNHPKKYFEADFKIYNVSSDTLNSRILINFLEPKQLSKMSVWISNYSDFSNKIWITDPINGKVKELEEKDLLSFNIPMLGTDYAFFNGILEFNKLGKHNEKDVYIINTSQVKKNRKFGPIKKIYVDTLTKNILRIENLSKKGKLVSSVDITDYEHDFPKKISIFESKGKITYEVKISDLVKNQNFKDLSIFQPVDLDD